MREERKESKEMQRGEARIWGGGKGKKERMEEGRKKTTEEWGGAGVQGVGQAVDRQAEGPCLAERPLPVVCAG